jgi:CopG family transcriptional regulator, nickel-responsive regulator
MTDLVRFGVAMEGALLEQFDALVERRGVTRSELLRDLVRAEVARTQIATGVPAYASLTLVYDHHVRDLTEKLTAVQHELGENVRSSMHVHLDSDRCLEVIVLRGRSDELQRVAERLLATRGVTHGGVHMVTDTTPDAARPPSARRRRDEAEPTHAEHPHPHPHPHRKRRSKS